jgi:hypothetical protein
LLAPNPSIMLSDMGNVGKPCDSSQVLINGSAPENASARPPWAADDYAPLTVWLPRPALVRLAAEIRVVSGEMTLSELCSGALFSEAYNGIRHPPLDVVRLRLRLIEGGPRR